MKVLILAPHPFYQVRGTPISVDLLVRALSERGDEVDLLTFHEGCNRLYEGFHIHRIRPIIKVKGIPPGFSVKKLFCDFHLFFYFLSLIRRKPYDIVHAIEESVFMAMAVCCLKPIPFVYDMDSLMSTQLVNKMGFLRRFDIFLRGIESLAIHQATVVVPVCDELGKYTLRHGAKRVVVLKDISLIHREEGCSRVDCLRKNLLLPGKIAMYIGNLESYQGIDLLLESFALVRCKTNAVDLIIIGGKKADIRKYQAKAGQLGVGKVVHFLGPIPVEKLGKYMIQANILISPRNEGVNTPMKIYSYLASGVPVLVTNLPTHTQVVNSKIAMLAPPQKNAFAQAMIRLIEDESLAATLANEAKNFIEKYHSYNSFRKTIHELYDWLENQVCK